MADGSPPSLQSFGNHLGTTCGIFGLDILQRGMLSKELTALHESHGMRMYLGNGVPIVFRQAADAVRDMEFVLTNDRGSAVAQQLVVVEQRASYGILDGQHTDGGRVFAHLTEHLLESRTTDELDLLSLEIEVGGNVMERTNQSLYRYSLHVTS